MTSVYCGLFEFQCSQTALDAVKAARWVPGCLNWVSLVDMDVVEVEHGISHRLEWFDGSWGGSSVQKGIVTLYIFCRDIGWPLHLFRFILLILKYAWITSPNEWEEFVLLLLASGAFMEFLPPSHPYLKWNSHHAKPLPHWGKFPEEPLLRMSMELGGTSYVPAHTSKTFDDLTWIRPSAQKSCRVSIKLRHSRIRSYE